MEADAPLRSSWGAATTTSWPASTIARVRWCSPGPCTPSSLVTSTRRRPASAIVSRWAAVAGRFRRGTLLLAPVVAGLLAGARLLAQRTGVLGQPAGDHVPDPLADVDRVV